MTVSLVARTPSPKGTFSWPVTSVTILGRWYSSRVLHISFIIKLFTQNIRYKYKDILPNFVKVI
jgi:hypothetical protein